MVFYILCFAILNLGLGYGLALYLHGHGGIFHLPSGFGLPARLRSLWPARDPDDDIDEPADAAPPSAREQRLPPIGEAAAARLQSANESKVFTSLGVELSAAKTPTASAAPQAPAPPDATIAPSAELPPEVEKRVIAAAVKGLNAELGLYRAEITMLDAQLRDCAITPDGPTVRSCAEKLRTVSREYLERQLSYRERLSVLRQTQETGDAQTNDSSTASVREVIELAGRQATIVASVQTEMAFLSPEADLLAQCQRMLQETRHISAASDELHAAIGTALTAIAPASTTGVDGNG